MGYHVDLTDSLATCIGKNLLKSRTPINTQTCLVSAERPGSNVTYLQHCQPTLTCISTFISSKKYLIRCNYIHKPHPTHKLRLRLAVINTCKCYLQKKLLRRIHILQHPTCWKPSMLRTVSEDLILYQPAMLCSGTGTVFGVWGLGMAPKLAVNLSFAVYIYAPCSIAALQSYVETETSLKT